MSSKQKVNNPDDVTFQEFNTSIDAKVDKAFVKTLLADLKVQFSSLQSAYLNLQTSVHSDVDSLISKVNEANETAILAKSTAEANTRAIDELKSDLKLEIDELKKTVTSQQCEIKELKFTCHQHQNEIDDLKSQTNSIETYSRKDNIVFYGISEKNNESEFLCATSVRQFMMNTLKIPQDRVNKMTFVRCHRLSQRSKNRPIIVRFRDWSDREHLWSEMKMIPKNGGFHISFNRRKMLPIFLQARKTLGKQATSLKNDTLTVSGVKYTTKNLNDLPGDLSRRSFSRRANDSMLVFGGSLSEYEPLSNWGRFPVVYNNIKFLTLEHAFMHEKCICNEDVISAKAVLQAPEPYQAKQIGDKIKITDKWTDVKSNKVMSDLPKVKFTPDSDLANELLSTGDKHLVESGRNKEYAVDYLLLTRTYLIKRNIQAKIDLEPY